MPIFWNSLLFQTYQRILEELRLIYHQQQQFETFWRGNQERAERLRAAAASGTPGTASAAPGLKAPTAGQRYKNPAAMAAMVKDKANSASNDVIELNDE